MTKQIAPILRCDVGNHVQLANGDSEFHLRISGRGERITGVQFISDSDLFGGLPRGPISISSGDTVPFTMTISKDHPERVSAWLEVLYLDSLENRDTVEFYFLLRKQEGKWRVMVDQMEIFDAV